MTLEPKVVCETQDLADPTDFNEYLASHPTGFTVAVEHQKSRARFSRSIPETF